VIDEEVRLHPRHRRVETRYGTRVDSLKALLDEGYDAIFVGTGAPRGRDLDIPGRKEAAANIHIGIDWLSSVSFGHIDKIGKRVIVLGGGNTAMDCCRSARRLGGEDVKVVVRSGFEEMKASPWEKEDAMHEGIPILNFLVPKEFTHEDGKLTGVTFEKVEGGLRRQGPPQAGADRRAGRHFECDDVLVAIGQENAFPWIERDIGIEFDRWGMPVVDPTRMQSTHPERLLRRRRGLRARRTSSGRWRTATRRDLDRQALPGRGRHERPAGVTSISQKMGIHEWSYDNDISLDLRYKVPHRGQGDRAEGHQGGGRARLRPGARPSRRRSAA
jgi:formate dehydrogenase (NADP+) beta subunit